MADAAIWRVAVARRIAARGIAKVPSAVTQASKRRVGTGRVVLVADAETALLLRLGCEIQDGSRL